MVHIQYSSVPSILCPDFPETMKQAESQVNRVNRPNRIAFSQRLIDHPLGRSLGCSEVVFDPRIEHFVSPRGKADFHVQVPVFTTDDDHGILHHVLGRYLIPNSMTSQIAKSFIQDGKKLTLGPVNSSPCQCKEFIDAVGGNSSQGSGSSAKIQLL